LSANGLTTNVPGPSLPFAPFKRKVTLRIPKIDGERPRWQRIADRLGAVSGLTAHQVQLREADVKAHYFAPPFNLRQ
jgi:hypothetical protein